jgi:hypothetical protein
MKEAEIVPETSVSSCNQLTGLCAREYFIQSLFKSPYGLLYGIISPLWFRLPHVFGHFPIGYKSNTLHGPSIKKYEHFIHPKKKLTRFTLHGRWFTSFIMLAALHTEIILILTILGCLRHDSYNDSKKL